MEDHIRDTAHALLDEVDGETEFDLMANLAALLPTVVIAEMIGVPTEDRQTIQVLVRPLRPCAGAQPDPG